MCRVTSGPHDLEDSIDPTHFPGVQDRDSPIKPQVPAGAMFSYELALCRNLGAQEFVTVSLHSGRTSSSNMDHARSRHMGHLPTGLPQAQGEVSILCVVMKSLIETADPIKCLSSDHHHGPIDIADSPRGSAGNTPPKQTTSGLRD